MRNHLAFIFITLMFSSFTLFSEAQVIGQDDDPIVLDRVLAVVGGHPIYQSDVESQYIQARAMGYKPQGDMKCSIFETLLVGKLLLDQSEIDSIAVEDNEVESNVERRIQGILAEAGGSEEMIEEYFHKSMLEIEKDMFKPIKEQMLTQRMKEQIYSDARVTPSEVQKFYREMSKEDTPLIPETIEIKHIVLQPLIPQEEIQRVTSRLREFREQIQNGQKMSTLAVLYSEDPGSQNRGGELGFMPRGTLVPEFSAVAYNLKKGDVSRVVKSDFGYHIIELIDRKGDMINARHILMKPKIPTKSKIKTRQELDSIADQIRSAELSFDLAAKMYSSDEKTRANGGILVNPNTASTRFEPKDMDPSIMVAMKTLKVGEVSEPFESMDETGNTVMKIISIKSKVPAHRANIRQDYQFLQDMALQSKQQKIIDKWIKNKQKNIYVRIHKDFKNCDFQYEGWVN
ncbi:MAG: peptidylprolyl isomerase [Bacteroidota bacterium]|nr:peptidylprolyl isomerase [Bacteroidota bacterium]